MNTRFVPFRLLVFVVIGVVAMGNLTQGAMTEGNMAESDQKKNLRAVDKMEVSESFYSRLMRKLDVSCDPLPPKCSHIEEMSCRHDRDCRWKKKLDPPVCVEKRECVEIKKEHNCERRKECEWSNEGCVPCDSDN